MSFGVPEIRRTAFRITIRRTQMCTRSLETLLLKKQSLIARMRHLSAFSASAVRCNDKAKQIGGLFCKELFEIFRRRIETFLVNTDPVTFDLEHVFHSSSSSA